jgi:GH24 family phage-related lysozyme (muramidase)
MIMSFESYRGVAYLDPTVWASIGYGYSMRNANHWAYKKAIANDGGITEEEAWQLIGEYIAANQGQYAKNIGTAVPQNVFNGLASFWYQHGAGRRPSGVDVKSLAAQGNWNAIAQAVRDHGSDRARRNAEAQLIANGCYPKYIVSKGSAKVREEQTIGGIRALGQALRSPGGTNGNRGWQGRVGGSGPSGSMNEVTMQQARRLLFIYTGDERPAVADAAKRALGQGTGQR